MSGMGEFDPTDWARCRVLTWPLNRPLDMCGTRWPGQEPPDPDPGPDTAGDDT